MPFTPYHFGPAAFLGLLFRRWLDVPVFILANVVIDLEVLAILLFDLGRPAHRYCHTLLIGGAVGALWGLAAYPLRGVLQRLMQLVRLPYHASLPRMIVSGILGAWLHVFIDAFYHLDIRMLWPFRATFIWDLQRHIGWDRLQHAIRTGCLLLLVLACIFYALVVWRRVKDYISKESERIR
jgi:membrane-bound metal-dependent hydrolase YbcI (DUF457 family)